MYYCIEYLILSHLAIDSRSSQINHTLPSSYPTVTNEYLFQCKLMSLNSMKKFEFWLQVWMWNNNKWRMKLLLLVIICSILVDGWNKQWKGGNKQWNAGNKQRIRGNQKLNVGKKQLDEGNKQWNGGNKQWNKGKKHWNGLSKQWHGGNKQ